MKILIEIVLTLILTVSSFLTNAQNKDNSSANPSFANHIVGGMTCAIVQHNVSDFEAWKIAYKADEKRRKKSGVLEKLVLRGAEDANQVTVVFELEDVKKGKAFFADPLSAELMGAAGVTSKPTITYFEVSNSGIPKGEAFLLVRHSVADYDVWKKAFDQHQITRSTYKISLTALGTGLENETNVVAIFNSNTTNDIISFLEKSDLKEAMKDAGVTSEPIQEIVVLSKK